MDGQRHVMGGGHQARLGAGEVQESGAETVWEMKDADSWERGWARERGRDESTGRVWGKVEAENLAG